MRTIFRLCLAAAIVAAVGLVAVPVASAKSGAIGHASITTFEKKQNKKIKKAKRKAERAHERIEAIKDWNFTQDDRLGAFDDLVAVLTPALADIVSGLTALQAALEDEVAPALTAIDEALNDPVTGLVGLNLARPQFGAFEADGTIIGSTGLAGGSGPTDDATRTGAGTYIVDFGNDVSARFYVVTLFPTGGAPVIGSAVNCSSPGDPCTAADTSPDHVLVLWQTSAGVPTDPVNGWEVAALSG